MSSLSSLLSSTHLDDHEQILKEANSALKKSRSDLTAQHVRLVAYIKLDRYEDALRALEDGGEALRSRAPLEAAYTLYKSGRLAEARKSAQGSKPARNMLHVEAQAAYRAEDFERAQQLYEQLSRGGGTDDENDLRINTWAINAQLGWVGKQSLVSKTRPEREDLDQFEPTFNVACGYASRGEFKQAEVLLQRAKDLCNATDLEEAEKSAELLPILVQQIYVFSRQGKVQEAEQLCKDIDFSSVSNAVTKRIAQSNTLAAATNDPNPYLSHRLFNSTPSISQTDLPFSYQSALLKSNALTLDLSAQKFSGVASSSSQAIRQSSANPVSQDAVMAGAFYAAANAGSATLSSALKGLLQRHAARPLDTGLLVTLVQLYAANKNYGAATQLVEAFFESLEADDSSNNDTRFAPGLVGIVAALYMAQRRHASAKRELWKAASYWRKQSSPELGLLHAAGAALLDDPSDADLTSAQELFRNMHSQKPSDEGAVAGVVAASTIASPAPRELVSALPSVSELIQGIDVSALEEGGVPRSSHLSQQGTVSRKRRAAVTQPGTGSPNKKRSIRPSRKPKDFVEGKQMDPERWLPLRERSSYRPKGKKKGRLQQAQGATQGGGEESPAGGSRPGTPGVATANASGKSKKKKGKR